MNGCGGTKIHKSPKKYTEKNNSMAASNPIWIPLVTSEVVQRAGRDYMLASLEIEAPLAVTRNNIVLLLNMFSVNCVPCV